MDTNSILDVLRWTHNLLTYPALVLGLGLAAVAVVRQLR